MTDRRTVLLSTAAASAAGSLGLLRSASASLATGGKLVPPADGKVMVACSHCDKPTRIAHRTLDNGRRVRVCRHCGEQLEATS